MLGKKKRDKHAPGFHVVRMPGGEERLRDGSWVVIVAWTDLN